MNAMFHLTPCSHYRTVLWNSSRTIPKTVLGKVHTCYCNSSRNQYSLLWWGGAACTWVPRNSRISI